MPRLPLLTCACCGHVTLSTFRGDYDVCCICFWEDDPIQFADPEYRGGANDPSLREAQRSYVDHGVSEVRFLSNARPAAGTYMRDAAWRPFVNGDAAFEGRLDAFDGVPYWLRNR